MPTSGKRWTRASFYGAFVVTKMGRREEGKDERKEGDATKIERWLCSSPSATTKEQGREEATKLRVSSPPFSLMAIASSTRMLSVALSDRLYRPSLSFHCDLRSSIPASLRRIDAPLSIRRGVLVSSINCLFPGVDGGFTDASGGDAEDGLADDCISTHKVRFHREFAVMANLLKQIDPLDTSVIGQGISGAAKESMKRTISTMLGLLPSDQFLVMVRFSRQPMSRLLISSVITGYTLWNAEYRVSLMRNFSIPHERMPLAREDHFWDMFDDEQNDGIRVHSEHNQISSQELTTPANVSKLSQETFNYIEKLESEVASVEKELDAEKKGQMAKGMNDKSNDLLDYLRSLEPEMVTELSRPSSPEVEEIIQQLVENVLQRFFKDDHPSDCLEGSSVEKRDNQSEDLLGNGSATGTSRDYLAKLIFWCMLLGHHMRGLEYRLHLSCVVGIL